MRVVITGASGLIGAALRRALQKDGHEVTRVTRARGGAGAVHWSPVRGTIDASGLEGHDVAVHLAGETIAGLWTPGKMRAIRNSRVKGTALFARTLAGLERPPRVLITMSAVGYYGNRRPDEAITEESGPGRGFLADTAVEWEAAAEPAAAAGIRVVYTRTAPVMSTAGGPLAMMLPLFRLGLGGTLGNGKQPWPWITLEDLVGSIRFLIDRTDLSGPFNVVAPDAVTNAQFTRTLAKVLRRPAVFDVPAFLLRLAPGGMADEMLLGGARVIPQRLVGAGYAFRHPQLEPALETLLA